MRNLPCPVPYFHSFFILSWRWLKEGVLTFLWREEEFVEQKNCWTRVQKSWDHIWVQPFIYFTSEYLIPHRRNGTLIYILLASLLIDILKNALQHLECYIFVRYWYDMRFRKKIIGDNWLYESRTIVAKFYLNLLVY